MQDPKGAVRLVWPCLDNENQAEEGDGKEAEETVNLQPIWDTGQPWHWPTYHDEWGDA